VEIQNTMFDKNKRVIIVGAGFSGMACGIKLLESGHKNVVIYEKNSGVGGTWETNKYPGLTCDVPAMSYTYSFSRSPEFSRQYPSWTEIREYCRGVSEKYGLNEFIQFEKEISKAKYIDNKWIIEATSGEKDTADVVIMATGVLRNLNIPDLPGLENFTGSVVHTGRWDAELDLKGKRVGVIGSGATCTQLLPAIISDVDSLTLFQRTAHWVAPFEGGNPEVSEEQRKKLRDNPDRLSEISMKMLNSIEKLVDGILVDKTGETTAYIKRQCLENLKIISDPVKRKKLTPDYEPGCKRLIWSDSFYDAMNKDKAQLVTEGIKCVQERGIVSGDGKFHELDILILATGYRMHDYMRPMNIEGKSGCVLDDVWRDGEFALRGIAIPDFPNMFMVMGPNSPLTNFSVIEVAEWQINYFMPLVDMILSGEANSVQANADSTYNFNENLKSLMPDTIWASGCNSYYLDKNGNPNVWPDTVSAYRQSMQALNIEEFDIDWNEKSKMVV
jgi:cation diffusion facilitator CzcD-associated flavoprotein CzcO